MHTVVTSFIMLIGCSFIVCLILITPIELQELCIKLALLSSLHFHPRSDIGCLESDSHSGTTYHLAGMQP